MASEARRARREAERAQRKRGSDPAADPPKGKSRLWLGLALVAAVGGGVVVWQPWGSSQPTVQAPKSPGTSSKNSKLTPRMSFRVVNEYPHDRGSYTQGLVWHDGHLFESTGQYGQSRLRKVTLETGAPVKGFDYSVPAEFFAEGIAILGDRIFQLTYKRGVAIVYDLATFKEQKRFRYAGEGWGLTHDGKQLIMSSGSERLTFRDPETFDVVRTITVRDQTGRPIKQLNELEYIRGEIWANVWHQDLLVRINPKDGSLLGLIDLSKLRSKGKIPPSGEVLNGIAWDPATRRLFVTGKWWPKLFEIELVPQ